MAVTGDIISGIVVGLVVSATGALYHLLYRHFIKPQIDSVNRHKKKHHKNLVDNILKSLVNIRISAENFEVKSQDFDKLIESKKFQYAKQHLKTYWGFSKLFKLMIGRKKAYEANLESVKEFFDTRFQNEGMGTTKHNYDAVAWAITNRLISVSDRNNLDDMYECLEPYADEGGVCVRTSDSSFIRIHPNSDNDIDEILGFFTRLLNDSGFRERIEELYTNKMKLNNAITNFENKIRHIIIQFEKKGKLRGSCDDINCPTIGDYLLS